MPTSPLSTVEKTPFEAPSGASLAPSDFFAPQKPPSQWADHAASDALTACAAAGDALVTFAILWATARAHFAAPLHSFFSRGPGYPLFGALTLLAVLSSSGIYHRHRLLDLTKIIARLVRSGSLLSLFFVAFVCLLAGASETSLEFSATTVCLTGACLLSWRLLLHRVVRQEKIASHLRQRILLIGWTPEAGRLSQSVWQSRTAPFEIVGYVELTGQSQPWVAPANIPYLGETDDLPHIIEQHGINVAWLSDVNVNGTLISQLAAQCEKEMVAFKIIPSYFPILLSAMHVETVCGTPILGVDRLPLNYFHIRFLKRLIDIAGALVGLALAAPIIAIFCALVYAESPGPVFYGQVRMGRKGKPFRILKIRSMRPDAEGGGKPGWTTREDPRRLRVGALMRKWNIDELPQFWNVLKGEMSLVGPRPERPELILSFKHEIEHYNARHTVKPGLTGWAQVNGLRGDTDLSERIRYDLFYMEHWSTVFDFRIIFLTFFRHANAC